MELFDVFDSAGIPTGRLHERGKPLAKGDYRLIIDAWIRNGKGEYLISRRTPWKEPEAGMWEPTCGSAVAGDDGLSAALREVREELGLTLDPAASRFLTRIVDHERQYILDVFLFERDVQVEALILQAEEVDDAKWATLDEILTLLREGKFINPARMPYLKEGFPDNIHTT